MCVCVYYMLTSSIFVFGKMLEKYLCIRNRKKEINIVDIKTYR